MGNEGLPRSFAAETACWLMASAHFAEKLSAFLFLGGTVVHVIEHRTDSSCGHAGWQPV